MKRRIPRGVTTVGRRCAGLALTLFAIAASGQGSVIKCIDADGNITYQDVPCTAGQAGRAVDLPKAETREDTSAWEAAACARRQRHAEALVLARGAPSRSGPHRRAKGHRSLALCGEGRLVAGRICGSNVVWVRNEGFARPHPPAPAATAATSPRGRKNRRFSAGRASVFAEIGAADRETLAPSDTGTTPAPAGKRYVYEPQAGDPQMRTVFSCIGGKVADVERTVVR
jgi:hypothetical protein